jgi:hypothetical protein
MLIVKKRDGENDKQTPVNVNTAAIYNMIIIKGLKGSVLCSRILRKKIYFHKNDPIRGKIKNRLFAFPKRENA